jgi:hypothetical protein
MPVMAVQMHLRQQGQQHKDAGENQNRMRGQEWNFRDSDQGGGDRHGDDQQRKMQDTAVRAMMMPAMAVMMVSAFAGWAFIQREFIANADIEFAHSSSLQNAAWLAASQISSPNHQKSIILIK